MKDITLWTECVQSLPLKLKFMVIRLKGKPQNSFYKYTKHTKFSNNMCLSGGKKFYFFAKFGELFFCNHHFKICPFTQFDEKIHWFISL